MVENWVSPKKSVIIESRDSRRISRTILVHPAKAQKQDEGKS